MAAADINTGVRFIFTSPIHEKYIPTVCGSGGATRIESVLCRTAPGVNGLHYVIRR
jgi:hypothetical protein